MKTYVGDKKRYSYTIVVRDGGERARLYYLTPEKSELLFRHSYSGFDWGSESLGAAQLALAILLDLLGDPAEALKLHQYLRPVIEALPEAWTLREAEILAEIGKTEAAR